MQQQQQGGGGGSQYGVPPSKMSPFSPSAAGSRTHLVGIPGSDPLQQPPPPPLRMPEEASPISSRRPARTMDFDELAPAVAGSFPDDEALAAVDDVERGGGGASGNRWPRQETLALLKIRSEMDAAFRDATLKGPLWEEVSRNLAELGYKRNAKKCKEKFENVHKYYKRTKEGRAGRQDGKSYRFFTQLEALYSGTSTGTATASAAAPAPTASPSTTFTSGVAAGPPPTTAQPISAVAPSTMPTPTRVVIPELTPHGGPQGISSSAAAAAAAGLFFCSNSSSSSSASESDGEETEEAGESQEGRKRKRKRGGGDGSGTSRKMMAFFDRLMRQVMERQEAMQQRFLEAIEKREQDRMIREEAWRQQEMGRLSREQELLAQERAMAASRDTAIISYLQKISGQPIQFTISTTTPSTPISILPLPPHQPAVAASQQQTPPPPTPQPELQPPAASRPSEQVHHQTGESSSATAELIPFSEPQEAARSGSLEPMASSSRWPKTEVHALINLRSGLEPKYQESGPKGTLWEEISAGMQRLGYNRSAKRCKEKWENINKYFKKVKESNKKRPEDSKTCPYFHQLDALYRSKLAGNTSGIERQQSQESNQQQQAPQPQPPPPRPAAEAESKIGKNNCSSDRNGGNNSEGVQVQTSNGGLTPSFFGEASKQPEDIVKELMGQQQQQPLTDDYDKSDEADSMEQDDNDDEDDDEEDGKLQYEIQFQRQNISAFCDRGGCGEISDVGNKENLFRSGKSWSDLFRACGKIGHVKEQCIGKDLELNNSEKDSNVEKQTMIASDSGEKKKEKAEESEEYDINEEVQTKDIRIRKPVNQFIHEERFPFNIKQNRGKRKKLYFEAKMMEANGDPKVDQEKDTGDFNYIDSAEDKKGGKPFNIESSIRAFNELCMEAEC
ncbi:trihelix transcription factor GTL1-like isoform X1 [Canna indica]|uniref:Trihelix transcription factor GTL1-like isoform X1 n=1 Tax=Canna indica TaxID=4628 RepID=A0AAQ3KIE8_9LILI|nr:trihelix transcription factor GTL1-like isoform X1 [Canna indica]